MKIAVTGATGFIGRYVVAELERRTLSPILMCQPSVEILPPLLRHTVVSIDLRDPQANAFDLLGHPDTLIHLAWAGLPNYKSLHHFEEELPVQYRFLKNLVESGLQNLVIAGTCFEYGMQSGSLHEELETRPSNPYGFAKNMLRCQLEYLQQVQPFNLTWARLFYLYGEGQAKNSLLSQLKSAVERGDSMFNMSGGEQLRDYLSVAEVAEYLVDLAMSIKNTGIVNICSGKPVSVRKRVEDWIKENNWRIDLNLGYYPYPDYEPMAFWGDSSKLEICLADLSR
ncbi:MAG TPA: epimerase [Gammaproteobacteria bacterium]|nr:epimerase [Gammaproteobacteria bacterium]